MIHLDPNPFASIAKVTDDKSRIAWLKAHRVASLSRLAGVYHMAQPFPEVRAMLDRDSHGGVSKLARTYFEDGREIRQTLGFAHAELHCAVTPYRLWTGPK